MLERKSLGFLPVFSPSLGAVSGQRGGLETTGVPGGKELKSKKAPEQKSLQPHLYRPFLSSSPLFAQAHRQKKTRLGGGPASWFLRLHAYTTNTHPFLLTGIAFAPRGPGGERAVTGLWQVAHGPGPPAGGHALVGAAEVKGLLFNPAFNNTRASSCETTKLR